MADAAVTFDPHLLLLPLLPRTFDSWRQRGLVMLELCFHSLQPEEDLL